MKRIILTYTAIMIGLFLIFELIARLLNIVTADTWLTVIGANVFALIFFKMVYDIMNVLKAKSEFVALFFRLYPFLYIPTLILGNIAHFMGW